MRVSVFLQVMTIPSIVMATVIEAAPPDSLDTTEVILDTDIASHPVLHRELIPSTTGFYPFLKIIIDSISQAQGRSQHIY